MHLMVERDSHKSQLLHRRIRQALIASTVLTKPMQNHQHSPAATSRGSVPVTQKERKKKKKNMMTSDHTNNNIIIIIIISIIIIIIIIIIDIINIIINIIIIIIPIIIIIIIIDTENVAHNIMYDDAADASPALTVAQHSHRHPSDA
jgi:hypothetical protein